MSGSRRAAEITTAASNPDNRSSSAKKGISSNNASSTNAGSTAAGNSATLTGSGAATLNPIPSIATSNIPMAEPSVVINPTERLFPLSNDSGVRKSKVNAAGRRAGTMEQRLEYAVSASSKRRLFHRLDRRFYAVRATEPKPTKPVQRNHH